MDNSMPSITKKFEIYNLTDDPTSHFEREN